MAKKILVGMSGGVDSSVCVKLLQEQGYEVYGAVIRFSEAHQKAVDEAEKVARQLHVPLQILDARARFLQKVIRPFCESYCGGNTPNPCVLCNPGVKFYTLCAAADEMGIEQVATGHYARVQRINDTVFLRRAVSAARDQSYMLYRLPQEILQRLVLPVGEMEKPSVRLLAKEAALSSADSPDSQEICFIPDGDYAAFIEKQGYHASAGLFIGPNGENLGPHRGIFHYTIGQRRGLHIALGKPVFVKEILPNGNIQLGFEDAAFSSGVEVNGLCRADGKRFVAGEQFLAKIRSAAQGAPCTVTACEEDSLTLHFETPVRAPAPGQSVVLYTEDLVMGGGFICKALPSE